MFDEIVVPDRTRPDTFPQEAELAWLGLNNFIKKYNELSSILNGAITTTSTTSLAVSTGVKSLTVQSGLNLVPGYPVRLAFITTPSNYMDGIVLTYNSTTGALVVDVATFSGTGPRASWQVMVLPAAGDYASKSRNKFTGQQIFANEVTVASATTIDLSVITSNFAVITGVTPIEFVTLDQGARVECRFTGEVPLVYSASLILQGGTSYTTKDKDVVIFMKGSDNVVRAQIVPGNGKPIKTDPIITKLSDPTAQSTAENAATAAWVQSLIQQQAGRVLKFMDNDAETNQWNGFITGDGALTCLGSNGGGQHGSGTPVASKAPVKSKFDSKNSSGIKKVVRAMESCWVLFNDGAVYSCGSNSYGQLGHGDTTARNIFTKIQYFVTNSITIVDIFVKASRYSSYDSFYALSSDGVLYACGYNGHGQLGIGNTTNQPSFSATATGIANIAKVIGATLSVYLLTSDGKIYSTGYNATGQLGLGDTTNRSVFSLVTGFSTVTDVWLDDGRQGGTNWNAYNSVYIRLSNGDIYVCGYNGYYNLGLGNTTTQTLFVKNDSLANIVKLVNVSGSAYAAVYAYDIDGKVYVWGYNASGVLGQGNTTNVQTPTLLVGVDGAPGVAPPFQGNIKQILGLGSSIAYGAVAILTNDGDIWVCGRDNEGQLGSGRSTSFGLFMMLPTNDMLPGEKIVSLASSGYDNYRNMLALTNRGRLFGCGYNASSQLLTAYDSSYVYTLQPMRLA